MWPRSSNLVGAVLVLALAGCGAPAEQAPAPTPAPAPSPQFHSRILHVWPQLEAVLRAYSWRPGCPVPISDLRYVNVSHWTMDGRVVTGEVIVHKAVTGQAVGLFADLFELGFPIAHMRRIDDFQGNDDASMAANNTSAFNCRKVAGTDSWSEHAYGRAIDVNPVQNPYVRGTTVQPPAGAAYLDRSTYRPGMLISGRPEVTAAKRHSWGWGGDWQSSKDYQHLSTTGR